MSDQPDRETIGDELGVWSIDPEDQLQPEDTLDGEGDVLDRGYRVSDSYQGSLAHGVTAREQGQEETIAQRLRQEEPDVWADYGTSDDNGDDRSDEDADHDRYDGRVGRLVEPDEGRYEDRESRMVAVEGRATSWDSPEESAMHFVDGDGADDELTEVEWQPGDGDRSEDE